MAYVPLLSIENSRLERQKTEGSPCEVSPINGRLEHLRGSALGFSNLTNYVARSVPDTGGFRTPATLCIGQEPLFLGVGQRYDGNRQPVISS